MVDLPPRRARHPARALALWKALREAKDGLSAGDAEQRGIASAAYARKTMRIWAKHGLARYEAPATMSRDATGTYTITPNAPAVPPVIHTDETVSDRTAAMTPQEFAAIRRRLGLSLGGLALALGLTGLQSTRSRAMRRFENGERPVDEKLATSLRALLNESGPAGL